jgi:hypothetical protein
MIPDGTSQVMPAAVSTFLSNGEEIRGVKARVRRLLELASTDSRLRGSHAGLVRLAPWLAIAAFVIASVVIESRPQVLAVAHSFIEGMVAFLS